MRMFATVGMAILALGLLCAQAPASYAQNPQPPSSAGSSGDITFSYSGGAAQKCANFHDDDAARTGKEALFGKIIPCLAFNIEDSAARMTAQMVSYFRPIFYSFLTLVIIMHGITTVQGEGQIGPRTFLLLVKIAAVIAFVESLAMGAGAGLVNVADLYGVMKNTEDIMASALLPSQTSEGFSCNWHDYWPSNREGHVLWAEMDCALGKIMGFALGGNGQPSMVLAVSVLGMMSGFFFGGTFGLAVFFAGVGFLVSLLAFVARVGFAYINAYMIVALYAIIAPIFIPLALLRSTMPYFQNWTKGLLGAMMMPVIVTAYTMFALLIFDKALFKPNSMVQQLFDYSHIADAQRSSRTVSCGTFVNDQFEQNKRLGVDQQQGGGALSTADRDPLVSAFSGVTKCQVQVPNLEMGRAKLQGMTGNTVLDEKRLFTQLMIDMAKLFILILIVTTGWKKISQVMSVLSGGSAVAPYAMSGITPFERSMNVGGARAQAAMNQEMMSANKDGTSPGAGGADGAEFIRRLPETLGKGATTFLGGVGR